MESINRIIHRSLSIGTFFIFVFFFVSAQAATHYVSTNGSASWANCTNISTPCSLATANNNADGVDVVYLRGGDYGTQVLQPSNSGSSGRMITFAKYPGETPSFTKSDGPSVYLNGVSYIKIDGLTFTGGSYRQVYINNGASYNEIKNCTFGDNTDYPQVGIKNSSNYNYFHDNMFGPSIDVAPGTAVIDVFSIHNSSYNRIIGNTFSEGVNHSFIYFYTATYNVIRGNTFTMSRAFINANRSDPNNTVSEVINFERSSNYNLVENNTLTFVGTPLTSTNSEQIITQWNSVRGNIFRKNTVNNLKGHNGLWNNWNSDHNEYNVWYNNTFYEVNNFVSYLGVWSLEADGGYYTRYNQWVNNISYSVKYRGFMSGFAGNRSYITNNQYRGNLDYNVGTIQVRRFGEDLTFTQARSKYPSEFGDTLNLDPKLTNPSNGNFALQSDSPAIDAGAWLTTITRSTSSGTSFAVSNPYFFYDGWGIPDETGDIIKIQNGQTAKIISINYSSGQIIVDKSISWTNGEGIALYYEGARPDIGAHEYSSENVAIAAPKGLTIISD